MVPTDSGTFPVGALAPFSCGTDCTLYLPRGGTNVYFPAGLIVPCTFPRKTKLFITVFCFGTVRSLLSEGVWSRVTCLLQVRHTGFTRISSLRLRRSRLSSLPPLSALQKLSIPLFTSTLSFPLCNSASSLLYSYPLLSVVLQQGFIPFLISTLSFMFAGAAYALFPSLSTSNPIFPLLSPVNSSCSPLPSSFSCKQWMFPSFLLFLL